MLVMTVFEQYFGLLMFYSGYQVSQLTGLKTNRESECSVGVVDCWEVRVAMKQANALNFW